MYERESREYGSEPPAIIGVEGAGRVVESGERVAWTGVPGSYAERIAAPRDRLVPVPDRVSAEVAAAALLQRMTAHYLTHDSYPIEEEIEYSSTPPQARSGCCCGRWPSSVVAA